LGIATYDRHIVASFHNAINKLALNSNSLEGQQNIQDITIGAVMTKNCKSISADKPAMAAV
jgi:arabinose-5-phosphate isomerase